MKKRWWLFLVAAALIASLFFPFLEVHPHIQLEADLAASFPPTLSGWDVMLRGANALPLSRIASLSVINMQGWTLALGALLLLAACVLSCFERKGARPLALVAALASLLVFFFEALHLQNLNDTLLFHLLLNTQGMMWTPVLLALVVAVATLVFALKDDRPLLTDLGWRKLGGVLCALAVLGVLLPVMISSAPAGLMDDPASTAALNRSESMLSALLAREEPLSAIGNEQGVFAAPLTGGLAALEPLSADGTNIAGIFKISSTTATVNTSLVAALVLLLLGAVLAFLPKVDRWFALCVSTLGLVIFALGVASLITFGSQDMYATATRQLTYLGVGHITIAPFLMLLLAALGCGAQVLGVRCADSPYFVNPVPEGVRLRAVALVLGIISVAMTLLPAASYSFYKPGNNKVQSTVAVSGWQALTFSEPDGVIHPADKKGKLLYTESAAKKSSFNDAAVEGVMRTQMTRLRLVTAGALLLSLAGVLMLLLKKRNLYIMLAFLAAFVLRVLSWVFAATGIPQTVGTGTGTLPLYLSLCTLVFAAFFSNFCHLKELPKKYRLFLMMLPFLVAVFLFSYMPLYGWSYAFYNYKFGLPMSQQTFVGFKWFQELFTNGGHLNNMIRVMKNTFAMSGLNILTSWMPMLFAILLNEVTHTRFKKLVQVFTTLPNFISWALVFSFAMAMFSMDTGIFSKFMLSIGAIDKPVAWLNSNEHIWLKMWGWSTWKGLGWGAIMYLAAIAGIDQELYEAARVDGAGRWKQMRYITLPGLLPTFFVLLLLSISNIINNGMDQYLVFQNSMNKNTIEVLDLYVYNITIASTSSSMYSFGTAIGILKTLFSVTLLFLANFASKKLRGESIV